MFFINLIYTLLLLMPGHDTNKITIPIGGNSWINKSASITKEGLTDWTDSKTICTSYFRVTSKGTLKLSLQMNSQGSSSSIKVTINKKSIVVVVVSSIEKEFYVGEWLIAEPGYVKVDIQGIQKTMDVFGILSNIIVSGDAVTPDLAFVKKNDDNFFYWGRRGPSVHLRYNTHELDSIEWFYNEITVPVSSDVIGSYFMANGFNEGYFGMQVNSESERRILFSVWSPFQTDDPKSIPDDQKIKLVKKGKDTYTGEFGNEGSGGQSYLKYNWKAGTTYKFLLQGKSIDNNYSQYTAYFFTPEENRWILIASFKRPKTSTYLTNLYSFLENFEPETGNKTRMALYGNQWVRTSTGKWFPLNEITFTADNTACKGYRKDYAGGVTGNQFYLKNCGFFSEGTELNQKFIRAITKIEPVVDWEKLD